jgi:hypothetical protein
MRELALGILLMLAIRVAMRDVTTVSVSARWCQDSTSIGRMPSILGFSLFVRGRVYIREVIA